MPAEQPIDAPPNVRVVVHGRIVTMDGAGTVISNGAIYVNDGVIDKVQAASKAPPAGYERAERIDTRGSVFPGLIDLHNHMAYNVLKLWQVPKLYGNRGQWDSDDGYMQLVSKPMGVLGNVESIVPAIVRYVECKCLVAGTTTSQGIRLKSTGIEKYYRGTVRNIEQTGEAALPIAQTRVQDVVAKDIKKFNTELQRSNTFFLHLSEGIDDSARKHFADLKVSDNSWAISPKLVGIHAAGLHPDDITLYATLGGAMIWSPMSNLLLYGQTARVKEFKAAEVRMGIGCDWSPSGSKNLLCEMKVARVYSRAASPPIFDDEEIVALATRNAASILGWSDALGTIEEGKRADLVAIEGATEDPYLAIIKAKESNVTLVTIQGVPRFGLPSLIKGTNPAPELLTIGGKPRALNFKQDTQNPLVASVTLKQAKATLKKALHDVPNLKSMPVMRGHRDEGTGVTLALDETEDTHEKLRLDEYEAPPATRGARKAPVTLVPLDLDPLTVADDKTFLARVAAENNLPDYLAPGLTQLYSS